MSAAVSPDGPPVPAVEDEADVAGANLGQQFLRFRHRVDERVAAASTQRRRADVLEAESDAVVSEDAADGAHPFHVALEVLPVGQAVAGGADPGAHASHARSLQPCGKGGKLLDRLVVPGRVRPGVVREKSGPPYQAVALHLVAQPRQIAVAHRQKVLPPGLDGFKAVPDRQRVGLGLRLHRHADHERDQVHREAAGGRLRK